VDGTSIDLVRTYDDSEHGEDQAGDGLWVSGRSVERPYRAGTGTCPYHTYCLLLTANCLFVFNTATYRMPLVKINIKI
jgi:hypothetical protein